MRPALAVLAPITACLAISCAGSDDSECGDGVREGDEECDDGNLLPGDGCDPSCRLECGNGRLDPNEECDDGNLLPGDGCDSSCRLECGNGRLDPGEECEPGLTSGCGSDCRWIQDGDADADADADADVDADVDADADADADGLLLQIAPSGGQVTCSGALAASSPVWHRPIGSCSDLTSLAGESPLAEHVLANALGAEARVTLDVLADSSGAGTLYDPMLFLYEGTVRPADALSCLAGNDDGGEGREPRIVGATLARGGRYLVVVTSFQAATSEQAFGTYRLVVSTD